MLFPHIALSLCVGVTRVRSTPTTRAGPVIGTYLEPWYTDRAGSYEWNAYPVTSTPPTPTKVWETLGFADVDGDGRDDMIRVGLVNSSNGSLEQKWVVSMSDGYSQFVGAPVWWSETTDSRHFLDPRFVMDMNMDSRADAVIYSPGLGWRIAFSNSSGFASDVLISEASFPCAEATAHLVSLGTVWCVHESQEVDVWSAFSVTANRSLGSSTISWSTSSGPAIPNLRWIQPDSTGSTLGFAVAVLEPTGDWLRCPLTPSTPSRAETGTLVLKNFTSARIGDVCDYTLLGPSAMALPSWLGDGVGIAVCVTVDTGYWHASRLALSSGGESHEWPVNTWKYSHGGSSSSILAPTTNGYPHAAGTPSRKLLVVHSDFFIADVVGDGTPRPLACNASHSLELDLRPGCFVMPPGDSINSTFETVAPALKSTNINLWQAWHLQFFPETYDGGWGGYDSADRRQARFIFDRLTSVGVQFFITDNTNGLGSDFGNTWDATKRMAIYAAEYNEEPGRDVRIQYALSVGVNPLGSPTDPAVLGKMESQLMSVWQNFLNVTTNTLKYPGANAAALAAAAYRHPVSGKPVVVLSVLSCC